jgi:hypothetical protein
MRFRDLQLFLAFFQIILMLALGIMKIIHFPAILLGIIEKWYDFPPSTKRELLDIVDFFGGHKFLHKQEGGKSYNPCLIILPLTFAP